jgi:hypothetical protein
MDTKQDRAAAKRERQQAISQARRHKVERRTYEADWSVAYGVKIPVTR